MRKDWVAALAISLAFGCMKAPPVYSISAPSTAVRRDVPELCMPPSDTTTDWTPVRMEGGAWFRIPPDFFMLSASHGFPIYMKSWTSVRTRESARDHIGNPVVASCEGVIGGRSVTINLYEEWDDGTEGWWADATWPAVEGKRAVTLQIGGRYPSDIVAVRGVFWTVQFGAADSTPAQR